MFIIRFVTTSEENIEIFKQKSLLFPDITKTEEKINKTLNKCSNSNSICQIKFFFLESVRTILGNMLMYKHMNYIKNYSTHLNFTYSFKRKVIFAKLGLKFFQQYSIHL